MANDFPISVLNEIFINLHPSHQHHHRNSNQEEENFLCSSLWSSDSSSRSFIINRTPSRGDTKEVSSCSSFFFSPERISFEVRFSRISVSVSIFFFSAVHFSYVSSSLFERKFLRALVEIHSKFESSRFVVFLHRRRVNSSSRRSIASRVATIPSTHLSFMYT